MGAETDFRFTTVPTGKVVWVDSVNGVDADGVRGFETKPFLTPEAAKAAAISGDLVLVLPGSYTTTTSLAKAGVNWHTLAGVTITLAGDDDSRGIWDDGGAAMTFVVSGDGQFIRTASALAENEAATLVKVTHASSNITINAQSLTITQDSDAGIGAELIHHTAGTLRINAKTLTATDTGVGNPVFAVWWQNGPLRVHAQDIVVSGGTANTAVYGDCNAAPTGDMDVTADLISSQGNFVIGSVGTNATAAIWIRANQIKNTGTGASVVMGGANRLYVTSNKLWGRVEASGSLAGLLYVVSDKVTAVTDGASGAACLLHISGANATSRISVMDWDVNAKTGQTIKITAGTVYVFDGGLICGTAAGCEITGGTADVHGLNVNTSGSNATNPWTKSGGVLKLQDCKLVAEATRDSIEAGSAQDVVAMSSWANTNPDGNVTITTGATGLTVDAQVA